MNKFKILGVCALALSLCIPCLQTSAAINGNIEKNGVGDYNQVIDSRTQSPEGSKIYD
jgi:hypothetical protein